MDSDKRQTNDHFEIEIPPTCERTGNPAGSSNGPKGELCPCRVCQENSGAGRLPG